MGPRSDKYFYSINDRDQLFASSFNEKKNLSNYEFTVRDPFNNTYNPAKVMSSKAAKPYNLHFESALKRLLVKRKFIC